MKRFSSLVPAAMAALLCCGAVRGAEMELRWAELPGVVYGKTVSVELPDGNRIEGKVVAFESDALAMQVKRTSDPAKWPKGRVLVPRSSVPALVLPAKKSAKLVNVAVGIAGSVAAAAIFSGMALAHDGKSFSGKNLTTTAVWVGVVSIPAGVAIGYQHARSRKGGTATYIRVQPG